MLSMIFCALIIPYLGIQGEDSGTLGCQKLGEEKDSTSYVTVKVLGKATSCASFNTWVSFSTKFNAFNIVLSLITALS